MLPQLDPQVGTKVGGMRVNHGAFVDDTALYTVMLAGLQAPADDLNHQLGLCGLEISTSVAGKSASLCMDVDGKAKKWVVHPLPHIRVGRELIPAVCVSQVYRYLGVERAPGRKLQRSFRTPCQTFRRPHLSHSRGCTSPVIICCRHFTIS